MARALLLVLLAVSPLAALGSQQQLAANPIRKVVTMLQAMQKKVTAEGEKEQELYDKFMCYCKTSGGDLQASIDAAEDAITTLSSDIKASEETKAEAETTLKQAQDDRAAAKKAMAEATAVREKEAAAFAAEKAEYGANLKAVAKAIIAIEKGAAGSAFLQGPTVSAVKRIITNDSNMMEEDRSSALAFLSGEQGSEYAPQSGQITGILKTLEDEMNSGLSEATKTEEAAIKNYEELMAAKTKEVKALSATIEAKLQQIAELGVSIAQMKNDLGDTEEALIADKKFIAELESSCATKTEEWEAIKKTRAEELLALADTIKVLNDDDALDLFKKTLPSASSFMQVQVTEASMRSRAVAAIRSASKGPDRARMDIIMLAIKGKKIGFEKVIKMIDEMVVTLKKEQQDDDDKKEYCEKQLDITDDKKKALERKISNEETEIAKAEEAIAAMAEEIKAIKAGIAKLDQDVAEATELRKSENADYKDLMAADTAAKEVLGFAKNRLNKFYNPKLYKAPPKQELSSADRIAVNMGGGTAPPTAAPGGIAGTGIESPVAFVQIREHEQSKSKAAPPPPPETFGAYSKKSEESGGVIAMIDMLVKDLDKEMTEAETTEKDAQADYEKLMSDSAEKRTEDSKLLTQTETSKADTEAALQAHNEEKDSASKELGATMQLIASLHAECDWVMKYYDMRKEARSSEIDALGKAKAVLSGADYSFAQVRTRHLRAHQ